MTKQTLSPIKEIISEAKKGKMFILVDDEDRENEGDLVVPGSNAILKISTSWQLMTGINLSSINKK